MREHNYVTKQNITSACIYIFLDGDEERQMTSNNDRYSQIDFANINHILD